MTMLGEELPRQMARMARIAAGIAGAGFASSVLQELLGAIDEAAEAIATDNVVHYLQAHGRLKALEQSYLALERDALLALAGASVVPGPWGRRA